MNEQLRDYNYFSANVLSSPELNPDLQLTHTAIVPVIDLLHVLMLEDVDCSVDME